MSEIYEKIKERASEVLPLKGMGDAMFAQGKTGEAFEYYNKAYRIAVQTMKEYDGNVASCVVLINIGGFLSIAQNKCGRPEQSVETLWEVFKLTAPTLFPQKDTKTYSLAASVIAHLLANFYEVERDSDTGMAIYTSLRNIYYRTIQTVKELDPSSEITKGLVATFERLVPGDTVFDTTLNIGDKMTLKNEINKIDILFSRLIMED